MAQKKFISVLLKRSLHSVEIELKWIHFQLEEKAEARLDYYYY